jgi:N-acyl-D-aspartate/D-glutamate deacylase
VEYIPDRFASTAEIAEVAKAAGEYGGFFAIHMRGEQAEVLASLEEALEIGRLSGAPVQISHLKAGGREVWGYGAILVARIAEARALGMDVSADAYPYDAASTGFSQIYPAWAMQGGLEGLEKLYDDPGTKARIREYNAEQLRARIGEDFSRIRISSYEPDRSLQGCSMAEILQDRGQTADMTGGLDLMHELYTLSQGAVSALYRSMGEEDIGTILGSPHVMVASDGGIQEYGVGKPHPRSYGTFPRVLSRYVRESQVMTLEEGIRKMTSMPAKRMGLADRGLLKEGYRADVVVFDEARIRDLADYLNPHQYPEGFEYVIVNGVLAAEQGRLTDAAAGHVLRGPGCRTDCSTN